MFKINNSTTRTVCEICSKLTIKTPEQVNAGWIYYIHRVISVICSKEKNYDSNNNSFEF